MIIVKIMIQLIGQCRVSSEYLHIKRDLQAQQARSMVTHLHFVGSQMHLLRSEQLLQRQFPPTVKYRLVLAWFIPQFSIKL